MAVLRGLRGCGSGAPGACARLAPLLLLLLARCAGVAVAAHQPQLQHRRHASSEHKVRGL
jgi:hypothetical protein